MRNLIKIGSIVCIAWFAAAALTPLTSVAIRNSTMVSTTITSSTLDSTPIGNSAASTVRGTYETAVSPPPNPVAGNSSTIAWNAQTGHGETDFVNNYGSGAGGGFLWMATGADRGNTWNASTAQMYLDKNGALQVSSTITTPSSVTASSFIGPLAGNVTGNVSGNVTGSLSGNASTASAFNHSPSTCGTGQVASGVNAAGNAICVPMVQSANGPGGVTGSSSFSTTSSVVTLNPGYGDTGYQAVCSLVGPSDPRASIWGITKTATTVTVLVTTNGSSAISYAGVDCFAKHN